MTDTNKTQNQSNKGKDEKEVKKEQTETQEVMQEIKEINEVNKSSNEHDVTMIESIVTGTVKKAELNTSTALEIEKLEQEVSMKVLEVHERVEIRKMELKAKQQIVDKTLDTALWLAGIGGIVAVKVVNAQANKDIQIEKIRQGHFE